MADEIINIATLTIDKQGVNESIVETRKQIFELQKANSELRKDITKNGDATGEQTKKFVENEKTLKDLQATYKTQQAAINDLTLAEVKNTKALTENAKSIDQAKQQSKELLAIRNQLDTSTKDGAAALDLINDKLNRNTKFIVDNGSAQEKAANISGNYRQKLFSMSEGLDDLVPGFSQARTVVQGFGDHLGKASDTVAKYTNSAFESTKATLGFKTSTQLAAESSLAQAGATEALTGATEASTAATAVSANGFKLLKLAIVSTGIGALVILLVAAVTALSQNEEASNKFSKSLAGFKGILNAVFDVLKPLGEFLIDTIVAAFDFAGQAAEKALGLISSGLELIGFDSAAKAVTEFTASVKSSVLAAQKLEEAEQKLAAAQRYSQKIQLDYQKQAEKLRQARDDESKSIGERIKANEQLGTVLKNQIAEETKIANMEVANAQLRIKLTGKSKENLDALAEAQTKVSDIQERIAGQESEQLQNLNSLRKEAADKARALSEETIKRKELEISILKAKNAQLSQSDQERLQFIINVSEKEAAILEDKKKRGLISEREFVLASLELRKALSEEVLSLAQKQIEDEIATQNKAFEENKKITEQELEDRKADASFLRAIQIKSVEDSTLLESEKAEALKEINAGYFEAIRILEENAEAARKEREAIRLEEEQTLRDVSFEMRMLQLEEQNASELEIRQAQLDAEYEQKQIALELDLQAERKTAEQVKALKLLNDKQYAIATAKIDKELAATKRASVTGVAQDAIAAATAIFGESKALAVAMSLINTYQGITAVWAAQSALPEPYATIGKVASTVAVAASGFASVKNILKTDKGSAASGGGVDANAAKAAPATFENAARVSSIATVNANPPQDTDKAPQQVLVLESLQEVQGNQQVKINSA